MKSLFLKNLLLFLLISPRLFSQDGKFTYTISTSAATSAGVFKTDGTLVRTLWNNVKKASGTYTDEWDGKDDRGVLLSKPDASYNIKIVTSNVNYTWQGTVGNNSDSMTGLTKHRGYYHCMRSLAFSGSFGYFCAGYAEGSPSIGKFDVSKPRQKKLIFSDYASCAHTDFVATDGINVYWGASDASSQTNTFVYATKVANDLETDFSAGVSYKMTYGRTYETIAKLSLANSFISGLAVQKSGTYLFVSRALIGQLQVLNKTTGALVQTLSYTKPRGLSVDANGNLWMITGTNTVAKYTVNANGTLSAPTLSIPGLLNPMATQVSPDGALITVADGGASEQVKFFNNSTGAISATLGVAGGYTTDATVNDNKFYFKDARNIDTNPDLQTFIAYQPDGSFWVNDPGNYRVQHYSKARTFIDRVMSLGATYSTWVDKNNIKRVFAGYLEFEVDYSVQALKGSAGWTLKKNWGANVTSAYDKNIMLKFITTLSNGRTYGFIRNNFDWELFELPATGTMKFTKRMFQFTTSLLCDDGSLQDYVGTGGKVVISRYPLTGFDANGIPQWSKSGELLLKASLDYQKGNPATYPNTQVFSTTDKIVLYNHHAYLGTVPSSGFHLGVMRKGKDDTYLFQTEKSTHVDYKGDYPAPGYFDVGNGVNDFAGGSVNIVDRNIITSYHGEGWKASQTNKFNHYYDNGLSVGQFGTSRPEVGFGNHAAPMMAGNATTPLVVKDPNGDLYLYHGDESDHSAVHRWKITGLNTIAEKEVTIPYPSAFASQPSGYTDLMAGLPFSVSLPGSVAGWTRNPTTDILIDQYTNYFKVVTSSLQYDVLTSNSISIRYVQKAKGTSTVSRDLGANNVATNWKVSGKIAYPGNTPNGEAVNQYIEVLDDAGKVLTTFYPLADKALYPTIITSMKGNAAIVSKAGDIISVMNALQPFTISVENGIVTFQYANYPAVTSSISDATGNWRKPKTLRARFENVGNGHPAWNVTLDLYGLKFYKDYTGAAPANKPPVANAGTNKSIILPVNSTTLTGSGTDPDGTISSYSWIKIAGPATGTLTGATSAVAQLTNLVEGVYKYELTVKDNNGATGKDTTEVAVGSTVNKAPVANAGSNKSIALPLNSLTLIGSGTDPDGTISSYLWTKISGPSTGLIATPTLATTLLTTLVEGVYKYQLTVTDNRGATAKDTVEVVVQAQLTGVLLPAVNPPNLVNGLDYKYYEGNWSVLPVFPTLQPKKTGTISNFALTPANRTTQYGFSFTGYITVPSDGQYTFYTTSDDGSNLYIDNVLVVANDGLHSPTEKSGVIGLKAGKHAIKGLYFQQGYGYVFTVSYAGPGITKRAVPSTSLYRTVLAKPAGGSATSGTIDPLITDPATTFNNVASPKFASINSFKIFPNPVRDIAKLNITTKGANQKLSISIYNALGVQVRLTQLVATNFNTIHHLDMSNLSNGAYTVVVSFYDGERISSQVIKGQE